MSTGEQPASDQIEVGIVTRPHGVAGAVQVRLHNPSSTALEVCQKLTLDPGTGQRLLGFRVAGQGRAGAHILKLDGVAGRDQAEALRGARILVPREAVEPSSEEEFFLLDLVGCRVFDEQEQLLGEVLEVLDTGAAPVLDLRDGPRSLMIPLADEWVTDIDLDNKIIRVTGGDQWRELST